MAESVVRLEMLNRHGLADDDGGVRVRVRAGAESSGEFRLHRELRTSTGERVEQWEPAQLAAGAAFDEEMNLTLPEFGGFVLEVRLMRIDAGAVAARSEQRMLRVLPMPPRTEEERIQSFVGINTHQWADWELFARLGIHWARDYVWGWYGRGEDGPVTRQGENLPLRLERAGAAGVLTLPCIQKTFVTEDATRWMDDTAEIERIFTRLGNHFPGQRWFQIGNEEEGKFPGHTHEPENYAQFIRHAAAGLRAAGHGQRIVLAGDVFMYPEAMRGVMARTEPEDFLASAIHIYTGTVAPELARRDANVGGDDRSADAYVLDRLRDYVRLLGARGHEVWITETGWDKTFGPAIGERRQAAWLPRMYLLSRWLGVEKVFWFFDRDYDEQTRFASSGLIDLNGHLRPNAATMAAMSAILVGTESGGSVDLGNGVWTLLWRKPDGGGGIACVWTVAEAHPAPAVLLSARERLDQFGNPRPPELPLTDEVSYFYFDAWPASWEAQRGVELLSHRRLQAAPGGEMAVELSRTDGVTWTLRHGENDWPLTAGGAPDTFRARVPEDLRIGGHALELRATGEGWSRSWATELTVNPLLDLPEPSYRPAVALELPIRSFDGRAVTVRVETGGELARAEPGVFRLEGNEPSVLRLTPAAEARGEIVFDLVLDSGVRQSAALRPFEVGVPKGLPALDAAPEDWPAAARWPSARFARNRLEPELGLAWSEEGLWIAATFEADALFDLDPEWFWTAQILEIFLQPSGRGGSEWTQDVRQFWLQPVLREGEWRTLAGEWRRRVDPEASNVYGHPEIQTALRHGEGRVTLSALIPAAAIGRTPREGETWRAAFAVQNGLPAQMNLRAAWPVSKDTGLLEGPEKWGVLHLKDSSQPQDQPNDNLD